jgi:hypothetical protein
MKKLLTLIIFAVILAPAPWGIAINTQTQQCAAYWGGDEYVSYPLPDGWLAYYPNNNNIIQTPTGECHWDRDNRAERAEKCCVELGYSFLDEDLGEGRPGGLTMMMLSGLCLVAGALVLLCVGGLAVVGLGVYFLRKWSAQR